MQSCILLSGLILVGILNDILEVVEFIGTLRGCCGGLNTCIVVIAARFIRTTWVYLKGFELAFLLHCHCSLVRLIVLDLFKHNFVSLILGVAVFVMWSFLIGSEMLINIPKSAIIQFYSRMRLLIIVFEDLSR